jgi:hypothetical protein
MTNQDTQPPNKIRALVKKAAFEHAVTLFLFGCSVGLVIASNSLSYFRELAERNTYTVESINRQALAGDTYRLLLRASKESKGSTETFFSDNAPCNNQIPRSLSTTPLENGVQLGVTPPGLYSTIRYHRGSGATSVSFRLTAGKFVFVGTVGDLPQKICFNEKRDLLNITYSDAFTDVGNDERILFIQSDDPGGDIIAIGLTLRSDQYIKVAAIVVLFFIILLGGLSYVILENGRKDKRFRADFMTRHESLSSLVLDLIAATRKISDFVERSVVSAENDSSKNFNVDLRKMRESVNKVNDEFLKRKFNPGPGDRKSQPRADSTASSRILDLKSRIKGR